MSIEVFQGCGKTVMMSVESCGRYGRTGGSERVSWRVRDKTDKIIRLR